MDCWFLASPKQNSSLLWKLILSPESCSIAQSKSFILTAWSRLLSIKMIVSSAYCKTESPPSTKCGTTPDICPFSLALQMRIANISTTILKSKGDSGSPCLTPFRLEVMANILVYLYSYCSFSRHLVYLVAPCR